MVTLISIAILLSGLMFAHRICLQIQREKLFAKSLMTKIGTFYFLSLFVLYTLLFQSPLWLWLFTVCQFLLIPMVLFVVKKIHQHQFSGEFLRFLSVLILNMEMGHSFRAAYEKSLLGQAWRHQRWLRQIYGNVTFSQQKQAWGQGSLGQLLSRIQRECIGIDQHQHQAIDRLCNFRKNFQAELFFRQKSRQIWLYFAYQLGLLTIIYLCLLVYLLYHYEISLLKNSLFYSLSLYGLGVSTVFYICRRQKWHI